MKLIPLTKGLFTEVDDCDFEALSQFKWHTQQARKKHCSLYYAVRNDPDFRNGKRQKILMHAVILGRLFVDHKDGNGLNNQRSNLRPATPSENVRNRRKYPGTSKYKGVHWDTSRNMWFAQMHIGGKAIFLGRWKCETDAANAFKRKALELYGEFANV